MEMDLVLPLHLTITLQELSLIVKDYIEQQELHVMALDIIQQVIMLMDSIVQINGMQPTMRMMTYQEHKPYAN